ncbi:MAG: Maf family protein [Bacillota bacterium]|nr:Maf family protein [Bacillota bacterium]
MKLYLASASPRRAELMKILPYPFEIHIPDFDERAYERDVRSGTSPDEIDPSRLTLEIAKGKAAQAFLELKEMRGGEDFLVLSADTVVVLDGMILGKGENREKSLRMLRKLNGKTHEVITAVCLVGKDICECFADTSAVSFGMTEETWLERYVDSERPFDKAGAYGIQDGGALFVEKIEGSYHNIMGLPVRTVFQMLRKYME